MMFSLIKNCIALMKDVSSIVPDDHHPALFRTQLGISPGEKELL